mmetsp:Transcript_26904/g.79502  ORF Transcript_26904/g.79502 Transcript_26904/m.79502 type:complete len:320 (-) Transcript_26904:359-1318(-)
MGCVACRPACTMTRGRHRRGVSRLQQRLCTCMPHGWGASRLHPATAPASRMLGSAPQQRRVGGLCSTQGEEASQGASPQRSRPRVSFLRPSLYWPDILEWHPTRNLVRPFAPGGRDCANGRNFCAPQHFYQLRRSHCPLSGALAQQAGRAQAQHNSADSGRRRRSSSSWDQCIRRDERARNHLQRAPPHLRRERAGAAEGRRRAEAPGVGACCRRRLAPSCGSSRTRARKVFRRELVRTLLRFERERTGAAAGGLRRAAVDAPGSAAYRRRRLAASCGPCNRPRTTTSFRDVLPMTPRDLMILAPPSFPASGPTPCLPW